MRRHVEAEILDSLAADDPQARAARRDLVRVHRAMGTLSILLAAVRGWGVGRTAPMRVLELGAGDGSLMLRAATVLAPAWPAVELTLLDRQALVTQQTIADFAALGWTAVPITADVLDWAVERANPTSTAAAAARIDIVLTNLFLHHFTQAPLRTILQAVTATTDRFFACEPRRALVALAGSHLIGAIGATAVTREDAVLSVHAGFRDRELTAAWPEDATAWRLEEYPARLFSHCFRAQRGDSP